jgi:hypothetical protein
MGVQLMRVALYNPTNLGVGVSDGSPQAAPVCCVSADAPLRIAPEWRRSARRGDRPRLAAVPTGSETSSVSTIVKQCAARVTPWLSTRPFESVVRLRRFRWVGRRSMLLDGEPCALRHCRDQLGTGRGVLGHAPDRCRPEQRTPAIVQAAVRCGRGGAAAVPVVCHHTSERVAESQRGRPRGRQRCTACAS